MSQLEPLRFPAAAPDEPGYQQGLERVIDDHMKKIREILNKGLLFADNFDAYIATVLTDATQGVETAITHGLKRTPTGFLVFEKDKAAHVYTGSTAKNATTYYIRSDIASVTVTLMIF